MAARKRTPSRRTVANRIRDGLVRHQVSVLRVSAGLERTASDRIGRVRDGLIAELLVRNPIAPVRIGTRRKIAEELAEQARRIAEEEYADLGDTLRERMRELAAEDVRITARTVTRASDLAIDVLPARQLRETVDRALVDGKPVRELWRDAADKTARDFARRVRMGVENGDSIQTIVAKLRGTREHGFKDGDYQTWKRNATTLVQTSVMSVVNTVRFEQMASNPDVYQGYTWSAIFDPKTCEVCMALSGGIFDLDTGAPLPESPVQATPDVPHPPQHPNCRCIMLPVVAGEEPPQETTYDDWLREQPEKDQIEALGPRRWELWSEGKLGSLRDLITQDGRAMTVKELRGE